VRGQALAFAGAFTDVGTRDTHDVAWSFGDGAVIGFHRSIDAGALTPAHAFASIGTYTVSLTVRDDDGGIAVATKTVVIGTVAFVPDPCDPGAQALFVAGTPGDDRIRILPAESSRDAHEKERDRDGKREVEREDDRRGGYEREDDRRRDATTTTMTSTTITGPRLSRFWITA